MLGTNSLVFNYKEGALSVSTSISGILGIFGGTYTILGISTTCNATWSAIIAFILILVAMIILLAGFILHYSRSMPLIRSQASLISWLLLLLLSLASSYSSNFLALQGPMEEEIQLAGALVVAGLSVESCAYLPVGLQSFLPYLIS